MNLKERLVDWYLTRKTGKTKAEREWESWYEQTVNFRAFRIKDMFENFEYILVVNPDKFFQPDPFAWVPTEDAKQYLYPARPLGQNAVWRFERVTQSTNAAEGWIVDGFGGEDKVFVATNNEKDAIMIALRWA